MNKKVYEAKVANYSDYSLYKEIKQYLKEEHYGLKHNSSKLDILYEESKNRNDDIYSEATNDALSEYHKRTSVKYQDFDNKLNEKKHDGDVDLLEHRRIIEGLGIPKDELFLCSVNGNSMQNINIDDGDTLIVHKSKERNNGDIIIADIEGALFVKRYKKIEDEIWLISENVSINDILIKDNMNFQIIGKVIGVFKRIMPMASSE